MYHIIMCICVITQQQRRLLVQAPHASRAYQRPAYLWRTRSTPVRRTPSAARSPSRRVAPAWPAPGPTGRVLPARSDRAHHQCCSQRGAGRGPDRRHAARRARLPRSLQTGEAAAIISPHVVVLEVLEARHEPVEEWHDCHVRQAQAITLLRAARPRCRAPLRA